MKFTKRNHIKMTVEVNVNQWWISPSMLKRDKPRLSSTVILMLAKP